MNKIKELLKEKGMSQKELASKLGITEVGVSKIVNGTTTKETMKRIADILKVSVDDLYDKNRIVKYKGEIALEGLNIHIPCYVLGDNTRVLSGRGMQEALKMVDVADEDGSKQRTSGTRLSRYLSQKSLNPFISKYLDSDHFAPIICTDNGKVIHGYKAEMLVDVCEVFLEAKKYITLSPRQAIIAMQCEILVRGFAKLGIIGLVDEATGYKDAKERSRTELQDWLSKYINAEADKWVKMFPDQFFEDIYKMRGWNWDCKPRYIGKIINDIVYERIAPFILVELRKKNPKLENGYRKYKHHQLLTSDIGKPLLKQHLAILHSFAIVADYNWGKFMSLLDKAHPKQYQELALFDNFDFD